MSIIVWGVFALTAGFLAIAGALVGSFLFGATGLDGYATWSLLVAVVGFCVVLGTKRLIQERSFA